MANKKLEYNEWETKVYQLLGEQTVDTFSFSEHLRKMYHTYYDPETAVYELQYLLPKYNTTISYTNASKLYAIFVIEEYDGFTQTELLFQITPIMGWLNEQPVIFNSTENHLVTIKDAETMMGRCIKIIFENELDKELIHINEQVNRFEYADLILER